MKKWKIPVRWVLFQTVEITADSLDDALLLAKLQKPPELIDDTNCEFESVSKITSDEEYIRWAYNDGQDDDI